MTSALKEPAMTLSIVTATYNAAGVLPDLVESLKAQTDQNFEWVVADGGSTDGTLEVLKAAAESLDVRVDSRRDFGIYDALNRSIRLIRGNYYLVVGADDELFPEAVANYKLACMQFGADLITAKIQTPTRIHGIYKYRLEWLNRMMAHVSGHSVGLVIKKHLHEMHGYYSAEFPIAADMHFVLRCIHNGATIHESDFVAGKYSTSGISGSGKIGRVLQDFLILTRLGHSKFVQLLLLNYRLVKFFARGYKP